MEQEIDEIRKNIRSKKKCLKREHKNLSKHITKFMITIILTLTVLILLKGNESFKKVFYEKIYNTNFSFAKINSIYEKYFGSAIPFIEMSTSNENSVFNESFVYKEKETYLDGEKFKVQKNYLMPAIESGMVVFIGEKEGYGNTIIIQQVDGVDIWYSNITSNIKLYDYIEKGDVLGEVIDSHIYLVIKKDGNYITYENYI